MSDLFTINTARVTVDCKEISESGFGTSSASGLTTVVFNKSFANITSIQVTPKPTTAGLYSPGVVFDETAPNPTQFQVFIVDKDGINRAVPFSWLLRGTQGG